MALIGSIEQFNPKETDISSYVERLEQLFICNCVEEDKKVPLLLTLIGSEAYGVLKDLLAPKLPSSQTYANLVAELSKHYSPQRLIIAERYKFYNASQEPNEDVKTFVAKLKSLSHYCEFNTFLQEALRDRLVCGIRSIAIKRKLLSEVNLTFEIAYKTALSMELAEGQVKSMGVEDNIASVAESVDKLSVKKNYSLKKKSKYYESTRGSSWKKCFRCTRRHDPENCPAKDWECFKCKRKGHTSRVCKRSNVNVLEESRSSNEEEDSLVLGWLSSLQSRKEKPEHSSLEVEGKEIVFEIDSGACRSVMHVKDFNKHLSDLNLYAVNYDLRVLTGQGVTILGETDVFVKHRNKIVNLPLVILDCKHSFSPLLGRNWLNVLNPDWRKKLSIKQVSNVQINSKKSSVAVMSGSVIPKNVSIGIQNPKVLNVISNETEILTLVSKIKNQYKEVFDDSNSCIKNFQIELKLKEGSQPVFHRAYDVPYALKEKVEIEIKQMVDSGTLRKVSYSNWASPIVIVPKKNSSELRICVDFKKTLNQALDADHCTLPNPDDIFASLSGNRYFSVIDLRGAYQQLELSEKSQELMVINTHLGLFAYTRLTYGVSSAPGIFQVVMDTILAGLKDTKCYLDDILVFGHSLSQCYENVKNVFKRLKEYNVKVNNNKCKFFHTSVEFLGHLIDSEGIHPTEEKIIAIKSVSSPKNLTELKSYLGQSGKSVKLLYISHSGRVRYKICTR
ncbi:hypothetical protein FQR65_LT16909 [Abscondita terminalis]|nr:hypothetical protein FQR65_LT16909 [Abscondita terminalis]